MTLHHVLHNGSLWFLFVCVSMFVGLVIGLFTERGSGVSHHAYTRPDGGELGSDLPLESLGRAELDPRLWPRRAARGGAGGGASSSTGRP